MFLKVFKNELTLTIQRYKILSVNDFIKTINPLLE